MFWYLVKSDDSTILYSSVLWKSYVSQGTAEQQGHEKLVTLYKMHFVQGDQINMAVMFWYLVKSD